jgi:hemerythrin-like domain-containing protein
MLRHNSLIPLSRQHQHALALCVRIDRASPVVDADLPAWQEEIKQQFELEIKIHFAAEENVLFPVGYRFGELAPLVDELRSDHEILRTCFAEAEAGRMTAWDLSAFAERLSRHIRREERELFERMQQLLSPDDLSQLGVELEHALRNAAQTCNLTHATTKTHT